MGVRGAGMLLLLFGDFLLTSLFVLLRVLCGSSLPVITAALGKGCSIQATSSREVTLRVVGG